MPTTEFVCVSNVMTEWKKLPGGEWQVNQTYNGCSASYAITSGTNPTRYKRHCVITFDYGSTLNGQIVTGAYLSLMLAASNPIQDQWKSGPFTVDVIFSPGGTVVFSSDQTGAVQVQTLEAPLTVALQLSDETGDPVPPDYSPKTRGVFFYKLQDGTNRPTMVVTYEPIERFIGGSGGGERQDGDAGGTRGTGVIVSPDVPLLESPEAWQKIVLVRSRPKRLPLRNNALRFLKNNGSKFLYVR